MEPHEINAIKASFAQIAPKADLAADLFYDRLFRLAPSARALFKEDMAEQKKALMQMLSAVVSGLDDVEKLLPAVQDLGKRHASYGALPEHYPVVGEALIWTLEQGLGDSFSDEAQAAWVKAYGLLSGVMIEAAEVA